MLRGEREGKPRLAFMGVSEIEDNQIEVECQLTTYNKKTVTFKVGYLIVCVKSVSSN